MTLSVRSNYVTAGLTALLIAAAMFATSVRAAEPASEDPAALASMYSKQAADLRASAERHLKIASMHRSGAGSPKMQHESIARHCEEIAKDLQAAAAESDALAETYRAMAQDK